MIPAEAVEAAAKVLDFHLPDAVHESGCAMRCGYTGDEMAEHLAAHILEAAAPHMLAEAWEEGASAQARCYGMDKDTGPNPYRPTP